MPKYAVITPEYMTDSGSSGLGGSPEPPDYGRDYLEVEASSAREAKVQAVRHWRRHDWRKYRGYNYVAHQIGDDCNPFTGLKAELMAEETEDAAT